MLILPDHPDFYKILHSTPPPGWRDSIDSDFRGCIAVRSDTLMLQALNPMEEAEYILGGEFEELEYLDNADINC